MPLDPEDIDGTEEIETTFRRLRRDGHSRPEAVQAILDALDVSLTEAKHLLLTHDTWAEAQESSAGSASSSAPDAKPPPAPG
jgi:hypothetical protein